MYIRTTLQKYANEESEPMRYHPERQAKNHGIEGWVGTCAIVSVTACGYIRLAARIYNWQINPAASLSRAAAAAAAAAAGATGELRSFLHLELDERLLGAFRKKLLVHESRKEGEYSSIGWKENQLPSISDGVMAELANGWHSHLILTFHVLRFIYVGQRIQRITRCWRRHQSSINSSLATVLNFQVSTWPKDSHLHIWRTVIIINGFLIIQFSHSSNDDIWLFSCL